MSDSKPPTFKLDDDKDALGRLCALSWFDGVRGEYELLVNVGEDDARQLAAKLTAWLDAPRLEARKTPTVVADRDGFRLLTTTSGEWGISDDEAIGWLSCEDEARHEFRDATGTVSCEACARFIDRDDAAFDSEGIYTCDDEAACGAAYDAKEVTP